ncbi:hypothetical protein FC83_GL001725 [Agrilactobacillus composti DSM 18527 = JCM 14202]|uniref:Uncharacterized protein n=2 Tax=Agrilactobacillus TaxID=2767875 RepID=A0A0R1XLG0_9LACO|nr:hypothetical protein FC83_GL001725 [Agrilactobacillus composti DSM 18527 = JCM 14202]
MILGTLGGVIFALGMCMALLPEWDAMTPGIIMGVTGLIIFGITALIRRKMLGKPMPKLNLRQMLIGLLGLVALLVFGTGMALSLVAGSLIIGIVVGIVGMLMLLSLIPMIKGFAKN